MRKESHFYYWICNLMQKSPFLWSKKDFQKGLWVWKKFKIMFLDHFSSSFLGWNIIFRSIFHFDQAHKSWISGVLGIKPCWPCSGKLHNYKHILTSMVIKSHGTICRHWNCRTIPQLTATNLFSLLGRVCEKMSWEESKIIVYSCRYIPCSRYVKWVILCCLFLAK